MNRQSSWRTMVIALILKWLWGFGRVSYLWWRLFFSSSWLSEEGKGRKFCYVAIPCITWSIVRIINFQSHDVALIICAMTVMASLVQTGVSAGVIYQIYSLQFFDRAGSTAGYIPYGGNLNHWLGQIFLFVGEKFVNQALYYAQIRLCYCFPVTDFFGNKFLQDPKFLSKAHTAFYEQVVPGNR